MTGGTIGTATWKRHGIATLALSAAFFALAPAAQPSGAALTRMVVREDMPDIDVLHEGLRLSAFVRGEILAQGGTLIPVLVPYEMTSDAATAKAHGFRLKVTRLGYTALLREGARDLVITGTPVTYHSAESFEADSASRAMAEDPDGFRMYPYEDFDDGRGGSISFAFRGADYHLEVHCKDYDPASDANCLEAAVLEAVVRDLVNR